MTIFGCIFLVFICIRNTAAAARLVELIDELNARLDIKTNFIYNPQLKRLDFLHKISRPVSQLIISSLDEADFNGTKLAQHVDESILFVLLVQEPPKELFQQLKLQFQQADFLTVIEEPKLDDLWLQFIRDSWKLGYLKLLFWHTAGNGQLYEKTLFPQIAFLPTNVPHYVRQRNRLENMHGFEIRVAVYLNAPRVYFYKNQEGQLIYGGFFLKFLIHFLQAHNATFVPIHMGNGSVNHCIKSLLLDLVDTCGDAVANGLDNNIILTKPFRIAFANIMVPNAKPLSSYLYILAPFHMSVWICLIVYIIGIVCFMSFIYWLQKRRWIFSKFLLETVSSMLFTGFTLKELPVPERYILFGVLLVAGFVFSTYYLCYLKSILVTDVFEEPINSIEQLIAANITLLMDDYDRSVSIKHNLPAQLWPITQVVSDETVLRHRSSFYQEYAYIFFSDRLNLIDYARHCLQQPRLRRIPLNIFFIFGGFPMRESWFLKQHLSEAWVNVFHSGLLLKLELDADRESMTSRVGHLKFLPTEYYEAKPLDLDYFVMPTMCLVVGYALALFAFVIELTAWRRHRHRRTNLE